MVKRPQKYHSQCESQQRVPDDVFNQAVSSQSLAYLPITGIFANHWCTCHLQAGYGMAHYDAWLLYK